MSHVTRKPMYRTLQPSAKLANFASYKPKTQGYLTNLILTKLVTKLYTHTFFMVKLKMQKKLDTNVFIRAQKPSNSSYIGS